LPKNKTELEQAINNSPFFTVFGENYSVRDTAKAVLVKDLWEYCRKRPLYPENPKSETYQDYGIEVWKAMESSIRHCAMPGPEEALEKKESSRLITTTFLETVEKAFLERQERIRPRLRALWTLKCFDTLAGIDLSGKKYAWIDYDLLGKYRNAEKLPAQKEVAALFGKSEQAASRIRAMSLKTMFRMS
jgi:hypothetical protein